MLKKVEWKEGLEYSSPARGTWNIVHTGMLIPQSHQIFVCAQGCLRGVVLTAAEMNALDRYSSIMIREENVLDGSMEELMIEGVTDILAKLPYRPRCILLFISCQHFFLAYDQQLVFETLRERFPDICFIDAYMIPTLRKSGITPDQKMRIQMYRGLEMKEKDEKQINLVGSNLVPEKHCDLITSLTAGGYHVHALNWCRTFDEYLDMAKGGYNLCLEPLALSAGKDLQSRLGQEYLYLPNVTRFQEIRENYKKLSEVLSICPPDHAGYQKQIEEKVEEVKKVIQDTPIALDYTFTFRILNFARFLLEHGFHVSEIFIDKVLPEEEDDSDWILTNHPEVIWSPTNQPQMRLRSRTSEGKVLAVGQKAAYFVGTDYFVNVVESGGYFGYEGVLSILDLMKEGFTQAKDRRVCIQRKGWGCESCI